jgi:hypothetical protein
MIVGQRTAWLLESQVKAGSARVERGRTQVKRKGEGRPRAVRILRLPVSSSSRSCGRGGGDGGSTSVGQMCGCVGVVCGGVNPGGRAWRVACERGGGACSSEKGKWGERRDGWPGQRAPLSTSPPSSLSLVHDGQARSLFLQPVIATRPLYLFTPLALSPSLSSFQPAHVFTLSRLPARAHTWWGSRAQQE